MNVGIDLGTTRSVVATPDVREGHGFVVYPGAVAVILDRLGRKLTPSVLAVDQRGNAVVGDAAKARAGMAPSPVMFSKRCLGEDHPFTLGPMGLLQPEEVSARIFSYLKEMAEKQLDEVIHEAVIAVPACFDIRDKQLTVQAAEWAGLKVPRLVLDPEAAALAWCHGDPRDPLRIMTYDLGGGIFEVAVLERVDNVITMRALDGERFLGGIDFDRGIVMWILGQLKDQGYDLDLGVSRQEDSPWFAKLMVIAEWAKIGLSNQGWVSIAEPATGIVDRTGRPVIVDLEISRQQFEGMIRDDVDRTIAIARHRVIEKAGLDRDDIDEVLMIGQSSRIPLVAQRMRMAFGEGVRQIDADVAVGIGAALASQQHPNLRRVLHRSLSIGTRDGPCIAVPAGTDLPFETVLRLRTSDLSTDEIRLPLFEGDTEVGSIVLGRPCVLPPGTEIELRLRVRAEDLMPSAEEFIPALGVSMPAQVEVVKQKPG